LEERLSEISLSPGSPSWGKKLEFPIGMFWRKTRSAAEGAKKRVQRKELLNKGEATNRLLKGETVNRWSVWSYA
jgi:hypothetical protein